MTIRPLSKIFAASAVALALSMAGTAHAALYELKFIGDDVSGDIFATTTGSKVTDLRGMVTDSDVGAGWFTITGLSTYASSDNTLTAGAPYFTLGGLSFTTAGGGAYNLADLSNYDGRGTMFLSSVLNSDGGVGGPLTPITLSVMAVPEPGNVALMMAGALGLFGVSRRRQSR